VQRLTLPNGRGSEITLIPFQLEQSVAPSQKTWKHFPPTRR
jgi:hypothetical protein